MYSYVVIAIYVRTDGWLIFSLKKKQTKKPSISRFVIKRGIFSLFLSAFRVKFMHVIPLPKCKNLEGELSYGYNLSVNIPLSMKRGNPHVTQRKQRPPTNHRVAP